MAEQNKQTTQKPLSEAEMRLNRQINYFIMRCMWQIAHGRGGGTIYTAFNMSRERFTRIIETGTVRYKKGELEWLERKTSVSRKIFKGEQRFQVYHKSKPNVEMITEEEWKRFFNKRKEYWMQRDEVNDMERGSEEHEKAEAEIKAKQKESLAKRNELYDKLKDCKVARDMQLSNLYTFMKHGSTAKDERLREFKFSMGYMGISTLDECSIAELSELKDILAKELELVNAILVYKKAKK